MDFKLNYNYLCDNRQGCHRNCIAIVMSPPSKHVFSAMQLADVGYFSNSYLGCVDYLRKLLSDQNLRNCRPDLQSQTIHWTVASFSPIPPAQCCFAGSKKYRKKSRHHCSNIERGEAGEGFLVRVARDFWLGL